MLFLCGETLLRTL